MSLVELVGDCLVGFFFGGCGLLISDDLTHSLPLKSSPNHAAEPRGRESPGLFGLDIQRALCVIHGVSAIKDIFVYDLMAKLRSDPKLAKQAQAAVDNVATIQRKLADGKADRTDLARAYSSVVTASGFNYGLLMPVIFPRYPVSDPLSLLPRPFMFVMTTLVSNSTITLRAGRQIGKCADGDTKVETESHGELTLSQIFDMGVASS